MCLILLTHKSDALKPMWEKPDGHSKHGMTGSMRFMMRQEALYMQIMWLMHIANVNAGEIKLVVRRDSSDCTGFNNVWHGYSPSWASGALYDSFRFSDTVNPDDIYVNVFYDGFYDVTEGSSSFTIKLWGDSSESKTTVDNVAFYRSRLLFSSINVYCCFKCRWFL